MEIKETVELTGVRCHEAAHMFKAALQGSYVEIWTSGDDEAKQKLWDLFEKGIEHTANQAFQKGVDYQKSRSA
jgi:hypothetical protein